MILFNGSYVSNFVVLKYHEIRHVTSGQQLRHPENWIVLYHSEIFSHIK